MIKADEKISDLVAMRNMKKSAKMLLPTDSEVAEWYDLNINHPDETASSAIYKFRLWLRDRLK